MKFDIEIFNNKDKQGNNYKVYEFSPTNGRGVPYTKFIKALTNKLEIKEGKEISVSILSSVGWRGSYGGYIRDVQEIKNIVYDPRKYFEDEEAYDIKKFEIEMVSIISRDIR